MYKLYSNKSVAICHQHDHSSTSFLDTLSRDPSSTPFLQTLPRRGRITRVMLGNRTFPSLAACLSSGSAILRHMIIVGNAATAGFGGDHVRSRSSQDAHLASGRYHACRSTRQPQLKRPNVRLDFSALTNGNLCAKNNGIREAMTQSDPPRSTHSGLITRADQPLHQRSKSSHGGARVSCAEEAKMQTSIAASGAKEPTRDWQ